MTCAKRYVRAVLTCQDGSIYEGDNGCHRPQPTCPRKEGEGYAKCAYVCRQPSHAEIDAMSQAFLDGKSIFGGHMVVHHKRVCDDCQVAMKDAGITWEIAHGFTGQC